MLTKKFCPRCKSENVEMIAAGVTGSFMCRDCGYSGSIFPEKEIFLGKTDIKRLKGGREK